MPIYFAMIRTIKHILCILSLFTVPVATAQLYLPEGLSTGEKKIFQVLGMNDPATRDHLIKTIQFEAAKEQIRRAGLLARCDTLTRRGIEKYHFDSELRGATMSVANKIASGQLNPPSIDIFRWQNRITLWALAMTPDHDQRELFGMLESNEGRRLLQNFYLIRAASKFQDYFIDLNSGMAQPAAPVLLKSYFKAVGRLPVLEAVVREKLPQNLKIFQELNELENYSLADVVTLFPLVDGFEQIEPQLAHYVFEQLSQSEKIALTKMFANTFWHAYEVAEDAVAFERGESWRKLILGNAATESTANIDKNAAQRAVEEAVAKAQKMQIENSRINDVKNVNDPVPVANAAEAVARAAEAADAVAKAIKAAEEAVEQAMTSTNGAKSTQDTSGVGGAATTKQEALLISNDALTQDRRRILNDINTRFPMPRDYEASLIRTPAQLVGNEHLRFCSK